MRVELLYMMACGAALLHNGALVWQHQSAVLLMLFATGMLTWSLVQAIQRSSRSFCLLAICWATILFGLHGIYFFVFLLQHTQFGFFWSLFWYGLVIAWFTIHVVLWAMCLWYASCRLTTYWQRVTLTIVWYCLLHIGLTYCGLWCFGGDGYPLCNPLLVLSRFALCKKGLHSPGPSFSVLTPGVPSMRNNLVHTVDDLARRLEQLCAAQNQGYTILSPESTFPFTLNTHPWAIAWTTSALRSTDELLLGTYWQFADCCCQALVQLNRSGVVAVYRKQHSVSGFEHMPIWCYWNKHCAAWWQKCTGLEGQKDAVISKKTMSVPIDDFVLLSGQRLVPCICSELFLSNSCRLAKKIKFLQQKNIPVVGLVCVHDGRFMQYMRQLCKDYAAWYSWSRGIVLWYVGW